MVCLRVDVGIGYRYHMHAVNKALAIEGRVEFAIWIDGA